MYLAIEGVIGVGKTSLARLLQPTFNAALMLEVFEENPFLSDFYSDRARYALQTQLFFLLSRYRQQREAPQLLAEHGALIADYTFAKDALFARINLTGDELELYRRLHDALAEKILRPDLLIYLRAPTDELMRRIARRGRPYERQIEREYIRRLGEAYDEFFAAYTESPTLIIEAAPLDYVANPADLQFIIERIHTALGLEYQTPLPLARINHDDERA
ncbi:MAG: deoxynucleoside kinase [Anaerolineales bacterium]|nr:deoxynucleoside kinase [Anaerolineales bacterium]